MKTNFPDLTEWGCEQIEVRADFDRNKLERELRGGRAGKLPSLDVLMSEGCHTHLEYDGVAQEWVLFHHPFFPNALMLVGQVVDMEGEEPPGAHLSPEAFGAVVGAFRTAWRREPDVAIRAQYALLQESLGLDTDELFPSDADLGDLRLSGMRWRGDGAVQELAVETAVGPAIDDEGEVDLMLIDATILPERPPVEDDDWLLDALSLPIEMVGERLGLSPDE